LIARSVAACGDGVSSSDGATSVEGAGVGGSSAATGGAGTNVGGGPEFSKGTGQEAQPEVPYPPGPYGSIIGATISNLEFFGFPDPQSSTLELKLIRLSDFYNPTGAELFPEGSPYGGGLPKPKAVLINAGAMWCTPCKYEMQTVLPPAYSTYKPAGAE